MKAKKSKKAAGRQAKTKTLRLRGTTDIMANERSYYMYREWLIKGEMQYNHKKTQNDYKETQSNHKATKTTT